MKKLNLIIIINLFVPAVFGQSTTPVIDYEAECQQAIATTNIVHLINIGPKIDDYDKRFDYYMFVIENLVYTKKSKAISDILAHLIRFKLMDNGNVMPADKYEIFTDAVHNILQKNMIDDGITFIELQLAYILNMNADTPKTFMHLHHLSLAGADMQLLLNFMLDGGLLKNDSEIASVKAEIARRLEPNIKRWLRKTGKTFVSTVDANGKVTLNPIAEASKPIIAKLNSARCEGLEAELRKIGIDVVDCDRTKLDATMPDHIDKILYGDLPFVNTGSIVIYLGVDGYNRFVDEFNFGSMSTSMSTFSNSEEKKK